MSKEIAIPFRKDFEAKLLSRNKTMTCRNKKYGNYGDYFYVAGHRFNLKDVVKMKLGDIAENYYLDEGCNSPQEFIRVWNEIHPRKGYNSEQYVYVHTFRKGE